MTPISIRNLSLHRFSYPPGSKNQWIQRVVYIQAATGVDYMTQGDIDKMGASRKPAIVLDRLSIEV